MEAADPIQFETPKPFIAKEKIDFIEELKVIKENEIYNIQFGLKENKNELTIRVISEKSKDIYYFQTNYTLYEFQNLSKSFAVYKTVKDIILFFKNIKFDIDEKDESLILKFNIFLPDGKNETIELELKKNLMDANQVIKNLFEEIKSIKANMQKEISDLKQDSLNKELNYKKEILSLKDENKKLWDEIHKLKNSKEKNDVIEKNAIPYFYSKIIDSIDKIDFILDYIRNNDKSFNFKEIKLLFRGSRDGDRTKTCHQLCDSKRNILIIIQSDIGYIFGGYSSIEFKINNKLEYKEDNKCFLFSLNLKKIYPVFKDKKIICHVEEEYGLCFNNSLAFYDRFMKKKNNEIFIQIKSWFDGLKDNCEMNGNASKFKCKELEVFQLI